MLLLFASTGIYMLEDWSPSFMVELAVLLARITRRAQTLLHLQPSSIVWVQVKSVAVVQ